MRVHLYEAIPGTTLSVVSALERRVPGLGSGGEGAWSKIHPLTVQAAGLLLREPGLGRDMGSQWLESRHRIGVGQRFYYIEIAQAGSPGPGKPPTRQSQVNVTIDLPSNQVRVNAYFSEPDAQRVVAAGPSAGGMAAVRLAQGLAAGVVGKPCHRTAGTRPVQPGKPPANWRGRSSGSESPAKRVRRCSNG